MARESLALLCVVDLAALLPATASDRRDPARDVTKTRVAAGPMTAEMARTALIAMVVEDHPKHYLLARQLPDLKTGPIERVNKTAVTIGGWWYCNLSTRTFSITFGAPPSFTQIEGKFDVTAKGNWKATITRTMRACR